MNKKLIFSIVVILLVVVGVVWLTKQKNTTVPPTTSTQPTQTSPTQSSVEYANSQYGFSVSLPADWKGYSIVTSTWSGDAMSESGQVQVAALEGPMISIRNPLWTTQTPYQDIPIMIFTLTQWRDLQNGKFHIGAAPVNPSQLGMNADYLFALPARYNYAYPTGWQEVDQIVTSNSLTTFQPTEPVSNVSVPHIDSVSPTSGAVGTQVTISGSGFTADNTVLLDSLVAASHVTSAISGEQSISFAVPSSIAPDCKTGQACPMFLREVTPGDYSISVENQNGTSNTLNLSITAK